MFCRKCGAKIETGQRFCKSCGTPVEVVNNINSGSGTSKGFMPLVLVVVLFVLAFINKDLIFDAIDSFKNKETSLSVSNNNVSNSQTDTTSPIIETTQKRVETFSDLVAKAKVVSSYGNSSDVESFDTIKFGTYYVNNSSLKNDIEWIVLEKNVASDGKKYAVLLSKYVVDCQQYNSAYDYTFWETSSARQWVNTSFYNEAFNSDEKQKIIEMTIANPRNTIYPSVEGGANTSDKVFLLSFDECIKYFENEIDGKNMKLATKATDYAISKGAYRHITDGVGNGNTMFWLRSPGSTKMNACDISPVGYLNYAGNMVNLSQGIRPAIFVWY